MKIKTAITWFGRKCWGLKRSFGVVILLAALVVSVVKLTSPSVFHLNAGDLTVDIGFGKGGKLVFDLGPIGEIYADTHDGPFDIETSFVPAKSTTSFPHLEEFQDIRLAFFLSKLPWLAVFPVSAGILFALGRPRRFKVKAVGGMLAVVLAGSAGASAYTAATFEATALNDLRYTGPIEGAPRVIEIFNELQNQERFTELSDNINRVVAGMQRLHEQIIAPPTRIDNENSVKFVVVSDIHSNPLGWVITEQLVDEFNAAAVLNAGDLTADGRSFEAELFQRYATLDIPHIIAPGNHENTEAVKRIAQHDNVSILEHSKNDTVDIEGIRVLGDTDPLAHRSQTTPDEDVVRNRCRRLLPRFYAEKPNILLAHNRLLGECVAEYAAERDMPLVYVFGHDHKQALTVSDSVVHVNPGTSGADGFTAEQNYGFAVLSFNKTTEKLEYVCMQDFAGPSNLREHRCKHF